MTQPPAPAAHPGLHPQPLRLSPGDDLRGALEAAALAAGRDGFVLCGIGSLSMTRLRLAGREGARQHAGDVELLSLAGSLAGGRAHLHASVADAQGRVWGGHVLSGCRVRTTAELLLAWLPGWQLQRAPDAATGYDELQVEAR